MIFIVVRRIGSNFGWIATRNQENLDGEGLNYNWIGLFERISRQFCNKLAKFWWFALKFNVFFSPIWHQFVVSRLLYNERTTCSFAQGFSFLFCNSYKSKPRRGALLYTFEFDWSNRNYSHRSCSLLSKPSETSKQQFTCTQRLVTINKYSTSS